MKDLRPPQDVLDWMRTTDLAEVVYRKGGDGFALAAAGAAAPVASPALPSRFVPVASPAVGFFQWSEPGKARTIEEGSTVASGEVLAVVVGASGKPAPVTAPCAGRVAKCFADAGEAAEYGRPLFLIEPR